MWQSISVSPPDGLIAAGTFARKESARVSLWGLSSTTEGISTFIGHLILNHCSVGRLMTICAVTFSTNTKLTRMSEAAQASLTKCSNGLPEKL